jgi:uncharacterized protein (TIGR03437 family)
MTNLPLFQPNVKLVCGLLLLMLVGFVPHLLKNSLAAVSKRQALTFEDRVAAQRAIETVYWRHRTWSKDNPQPKPTLDAIMPETILRAKVEKYLRKSYALEVYWRQPITAERLQEEMQRMVINTRQPEILSELWVALGNDPVIIAECLARQLLAERELHVLSEGCGIIDAELERLLNAFPIIPLDFLKSSAESFAFQLPELRIAANPCGVAWTPTSIAGAPNGRTMNTAIWTGTEMIIWGGSVLSNDANTGGRYNPVTDSWTTTTLVNAPSARREHTAVWTGIEMIIWGGKSSGEVNTGGRYNPTTDTWISTNIVNAPTERSSHTAVWTGKEMIIWGGARNSTSLLNTGSRYNPSTNTWAATRIPANTPNSPRVSHTAVWTGKEMIIWGGFINLSGFLEPDDSGGIYIPATDTWTGISNNSPQRRGAHSAVWTGTEMIIWGGGDANGNNNVFSDTGGRYNLEANNWNTIAGLFRPYSRFLPTLVWSGSEVLLWGGFAEFSGNPLTNTGARLGSGVNSNWTPTTTAGAPSPRKRSSGVWAGREFIVWGGNDGSSDVNTGGRLSHDVIDISMSPREVNYSASGVDRSVELILESPNTTCTWTVMSNVDWLIPAASSGTYVRGSSGFILYKVLPNTSQSPRVGMLTVSGHKLTVLQSGENPKPTLTEISPNFVAAGSSAIMVNITGAGFVAGATVRWNGNNRPTSIVSSTQLTVQIPASDLSTMAEASITVFNPAPSGGVSNSLSFLVSPTLATVSAASYSNIALAPQVIAASFGTNLATQTLAASTTPLPTMLSGTTVRVKDSMGAERLAPLFFVASGQINYLIPQLTANGSAIVSVTNSSGNRSVGAIQVATIAPALFTANANGQGAPAAVVLRARGTTQTFEPIARLDTATNRFIPALIDLGAESEQIVLLLFGTGIRGRSSLGNVTCQIGGVVVPVSFAGAQGDLVGLDQINVGTLPRTLAGRGEVDLVLLVDGKAANTVRVAIR